LKERIYACFEEIREQNPLARILLVLDNFSSHICAHTRKRAHELGIDLVFLPVGSPHLNPIEPVWKRLRWESSPLIEEDARVPRPPRWDLHTIDWPVKFRRTMDRESPQWIHSEVAL